MIQIADYNIDKYNAIIRDNPHGTRRLEKRKQFPIAHFEVILSPLNAEDYANLVTWSGAESASYIAGSISSFHKKWIVTGDKISPKSHYSTNNKEHKLLLSIVECLETQVLSLNSMNFFKTLEKDNQQNNLQYSSSRHKHGIFLVPCALIMPQDPSQLEIYILENAIKKH
ncbi:MAG: hypothetical protein ACP5N2_01910 [Candidatus Nanoarchaeia archaeon]